MPIPAVGLVSKGCRGARMIRIPLTCLSRGGRLRRFPSASIRSAGDLCVISTWSVRRMPRLQSSVGVCLAPRVGTHFSLPCCPKRQTAREAAGGAAAGEPGGAAAVGCGDLSDFPARPERMPSGPAELTYSVEAHQSHDPAAARPCRVGAGSPPTRPPPMRVSDLVRAAWILLELARRSK